MVHSPDGTIWHKFRVRVGFGVRSRSRDKNCVWSLGLNQSHGVWVWGQRGVIIWILQIKTFHTPESVSSKTQVIAPKANTISPEYIQWHHKGIMMSPQLLSIFKHMGLHFMEMKASLSCMSRIDLGGVFQRIKGVKVFNVLIETWE